MPLNSSDDNIKKNLRLSFLLLIFALVFVTYLYRLFVLQIVQGGEYRSQSKQISSTMRTIPAQRGEIFDRNANMPLVINTDSFSVSVIPGEIPSNLYDTVILKLA
ncbi:MAG: penicillin-binding protein 2, partial [Treponema sp.]|nr:penicillin-binding protein 2 [Treponema sp.]